MARFRLGTIAVMAGALVLAACSGNSPSSQSSSNTPAGSGSASTAAAGPSGTLRVATDTPPDPWDPALATPQDVNMLYYQGPYEFLVNTDGDGKLVPGLATSWEQTPTSLTLHLRTGVKFSDGTVFDAAAVKANIEHQQKDGIPPNQAKFMNVTSMDVVSADVLKLNLSHPTPQLISNLARQQGMMASPAALKDLKKLATNPVGTGGWLLDTAATVPNSKYVFTANPNYWNKAAQGVQKIEISYIPDQQARANALLTHSVDYAALDFQFASQVKSAGFTVQSVPSYPYFLQIMDRAGTMVPAFKDPRVRLAMAYAIDQKSFFDVTMSGFGVPSNQWTIPGQYGYNADYKGLGYDLAKAQQLMKDAGVSSLEFSIPSYGPFDNYNTAIAGFLAKIGITMKLVPSQTGNISGEAASGKFPAAILPAHEVHPQDFYNTRVASFGTQNPFKVAAPDIDAVMATVTGKDPAADEAAYKKMAGMVSDEGIVIPLGVVSCLQAWDPKHVTGVTPWQWTCGNVRFAGMRVN